MTSSHSECPRQASYHRTRTFIDPISPISRGRASSIAIILLGSIWYTWVKHVESQQAPPAKAQYEPVPLDELEQGKNNNKGENGHGHSRRSSGVRDARD